MKILVGIGALGVIIGAVFWLLYLGDAPAPDVSDRAEETSAARDTRAGNRLQPTGAGGPVGDGLGEHADVIGAIAHGLAQDGGVKQDAGVDLGPQGPLSYDEAKLERKLKLRAGTRQLMPVVRDCLKRAVKEQPALASPKHKAQLTVEGTREQGGKVAKIELVGPGGPLTAPVLEGCIRASTQDMLLAVPPVPGGGPIEPTVYSFPLLAP